MKVLQDERLVAVVYHTAKEMVHHKKKMENQGFELQYSFEEKGRYKSYYKKYYEVNR